MNEETKKQIADDIELAKSMSDINSAVEVLDLTNRLIDYQDQLLSSLAEMEYKSAQMSAKVRTLKDYIMVSKKRYTELSILEYSKSK